MAVQKPARLGRRLGLYEVAEAAEEAQRGIDFIVFALALLQRRFGLLAAAPEDDTIMGVENGEPNLEDIRGRRRAAGRGRAVAAATTAADAYAAGVRDGGADGDDEVGLRRVADHEVVAPALEGIADDIVRSEE